MNPATELRQTGTRQQFVYEMSLAETTTATRMAKKQFIVKQNNDLARARVLNVNSLFCTFLCRRCTTTSRGRENKKTIY